MTDNKKRGLGRPKGTGVYTSRQQICLSDQEIRSIESIQQKYPEFNVSDCIRFAVNQVANDLSGAKGSSDEQS